MLGTQQSLVLGNTKRSSNVVTRSKRSNEDDIVETRILSLSARGGRKKSIVMGGRATHSVRGGALECREGYPEVESKKDLQYLLHHLLCIRNNHDTDLQLCYHLGCQVKGY